MTLISQLGYKPNRSKRLMAPELYSNKDVSVIIPVKDNEVGLLKLLEAFRKWDVSQLPYEILVVDNNSVEEVQADPKFDHLQYKILKCKKPGAAAARNAGVKEARANWLLFIDSDCLPTESMLSGYFRCRNGAVGYAGNIKATGQTILSAYYDTQEILIPPEAIDGGKVSPDYLITVK